jgi:hypothetical protein
VAASLVETTNAHKGEFVMQDDNMLDTVGTCENHSTREMFPRVVIVFSMVSNLFYCE